MLEWQRLWKCLIQKRYGSKLLYLWLIATSERIYVAKITAIQRPIILEVSSALISLSIYEASASGNSTFTLQVKGHCHCAC